MTDKSLLDASRNDSFEKWAKEVTGGTAIVFQDESKKAGKFSECVRVRVENHDTSLILKRSIVKEMSQRPNVKWHRDVASFMAEARFYQLASNHQSQTLGETLWPALLRGACHPPRPGELDTLLEDDSDNSRPSDQIWFAYFLEDLEQAGYGQMSGLTLPLFYSALKSLAKFHHNATHLFETAETHGAANSVLPIWAHGSFWVRDKRDDFYEEVKGIPERFSGIFANFKQDMTEAGIRESLGKELSSHCDEISDSVDGFGYNFIIHGDSKTANIFHRVLNSSDEWRWIDFQWLGWGHPILDIMYLVISSLEDVDKFNLQEALEHYFVGSEAHRDRVMCNLSGTEVLEKYFMIAFLDYARVVFGYMWDSSVTEEVVAKRKINVNMCLHNRSKRHVIWFTKTTQEYLDKLGYASDPD